jgi:hypothetical protein
MRNRTTRPKATRRTNKQLDLVSERRSGQSLREHLLVDVAGRASPSRRRFVEDKVELELVRLAVKGEERIKTGVGSQRERKN